MSFFKVFFEKRKNIKLAKKVLIECQMYLPDTFESTTTPATFEQFQEFLNAHEFELAMEQLESIADDLEFQNKVFVPEIFWQKMYALALKMKLEISEYYKSKINR